MGDVLEHGRLASLWRRYDKTALSLSDGSNQVDDPRHHQITLAIDLEAETLIGEQWRQRRELGAACRNIRFDPVDLRCTYERREFLLRPCDTNRSFDDVTLAETVLSDNVGRDIDVLVAWEVARDPEEAVPLGKDVEDSLPDLEF